MKEIKAVIQPFVLDAVINALKQIPDLPGITVSEVKGFGRSRGVDAAEKVIEGTTEYARKVKLEIVVADSLVEGVIQVLVANAHRGKPGDGKIFISTVDDVVKVRTGERGELGI